MLIELNEDTLQNIVESNEKVVVQFSASMVRKLPNYETEIQEVSF